MAKNSAFRVIIEPASNLTGIGQSLFIIDNRSGDQPLRITKIGYEFTFNNPLLAAGVQTGQLKLHKAASSSSGWSDIGGGVAARKTPFETSANDGDTRAVIYKMTTSLSGYIPPTSDPDLIDVKSVTYYEPAGVMNGCIIQVGEGAIMRYRGSPTIGPVVIIIEGID